MQKEESHHRITAAATTRNTLPSMNETQREDIGFFKSWKIERMISRYRNPDLWGESIALYLEKGPVELAPRQQIWKFPVVDAGVSERHDAAGSLNIAKTAKS